ncbi:MAG: hypothetical protein IJP16_05015 [Clostridia bacterium]|nr:hypothetical protein [Clostridia bacterium]MBQ9975852.1 hypothetical protein [Clostridia bacterium]
MNSATIEYMSAINTLRDFSEKEAGLSVEIFTDGLKTKLENSLKFLIDATTLKKLLRLSEKTSILFYYSFCERALSEQPPPKD